MVYEPITWFLIVFLKKLEIAWENDIKPVYDIYSCWTPVSIILSTPKHGLLSGVIAPVFVEFTVVAPVLKVFPVEPKW